MHATALSRTTLYHAQIPLRAPWNSCARGDAQLVCSSSRLLQQHTVAAAASNRLGTGTRASAAFAETWVAPARPTARQKEAQRPRKVQQVVHNHQQHTRLPPVASPQPSPAVNSQAGTSSEASSDDEAQQIQAADSQTTTGQHLSSAVDKMYRKRLREVKTLLSPEALQQLQQELTPEQRQSLQLVLQDLQDLQGSWEEEDEQLSEAEQQLVQQITNTQIMPDDFSSYLMAMLPEGSGPAELQDLLQSLDSNVLQDIQSVYYDLKEFEQAEIDMQEAQERYVELSSRIAGVTARVQGTLADQQQRLNRKQQPPKPKRFSDVVLDSSSSSNGISGSSSRSSSSSKQPPSLVAATQQAVKSAAAPARRGATSAASSSSGSSSSSGGKSGTSSSKGWGSSWAAKPRAGRGNATNQNKAADSARQGSSQAVQGQQHAGWEPSQQQQQLPQQDRVMQGLERQQVLVTHPAVTAAGQTARQQHPHQQQAQQAQQAQPVQQQSEAQMLLVESQQQAQQQQQHDSLAAQQQPAAGGIRQRRRRIVIRRDAAAEQ